MDMFLIVGLAFAAIAVVFFVTGRRKCSKGRWIGSSSDEDFLEERKEWRQGYNCYIVAVFSAISACIVLCGSDCTEYILGIGLVVFIAYQLFKK